MFPDLGKEAKPLLPPLPNPTPIAELESVGYNSDEEDPNLPSACYYCKCTGTVIFKFNSMAMGDYLNKLKTYKAPNTDKENMKKAIAESKSLDPKIKATRGQISSSLEGALGHARNSLRTKLKGDADIRMRYFWEYESVDFTDCECTIMGEDPERWTRHPSKPHPSKPHPSNQSRSNP